MSESHFQYICRLDVKFREIFKNTLSDGTLADASFVCFASSQFLHYIVYSLHENCIITELFLVRILDTFHYALSPLTDIFIMAIGHFEKPFCHFFESTDLKAQNNKKA